MPGTDTQAYPYPAAGHPGDAAVDLQTTHRVVLDPHTTQDAHTGWRLTLHELTAGEVQSRSGLSGRGIVVANSPGLVDPTYTGEVIVRLHNQSSSRVVLEAGDRVAQLKVIPVVIPAVHATDNARGDAGLGSTGLTDADRAAGYTSVDGVSVPETPDVHRPWRDNGGKELVYGLTPVVTSSEDTREVLDREDPLPEAEVPEVTVTDMVNHPPHYEGHAIFPGECWGYLERLTAAQYAAGKYLWRWNGKGDPAENLRKAIWYLDRGLELAEASRQFPEDITKFLGGEADFQRLDVAMTEATDSIIHAANAGVDKWFTAEELAAAYGFLDVVRGRLDTARSWATQALRFLERHTD